MTNTSPLMPLSQAALATAMCAAIGAGAADAAHAAPAGEPLQATVVVATSPEASARARAALSIAEFDALRGSYQLDDGTVLSLGGTRLRPVLDSSDAQSSRLVVVSPVVLETPDGRVRLEVRQASNGSVTELRVQRRRGGEAS